MRIRDLFRSPTAGVDGNTVTKKASEDTREKTGLTNAGDAGDTVSISPLARQFQLFSQVLSEDDAKRRNRVEELKKQVESGEYSVDSKDVAESLVSFAQGV